VEPNRFQAREEVSREASKKRAREAASERSRLGRVGARGEGRGRRSRVLRTRWPRAVSALAIWLPWTFRPWSSGQSGTSLTIRTSQPLRGPMVEMTGSWRVMLMTRLD